MATHDHQQNKKRASILIVEDEALVRIMVSEYLEEAGYQVTEACSADEAVSILHSDVRIDLMLTDVRMPGSMDGLGLLEYSRERFPKLPVVVMSGHLLPGDALAKGAAHFIAKPYLFDDTVSIVGQALANRL